MIRQEELNFEWDEEKEKLNIKKHGGSIMAVIKKTIVKGQGLTHEQLMELEAASKMPIVYDEDSPELTEEQYAQIAEAARNRRNANKKTVIALRISPDTLAKAKATGKGYTGFLSRLLDNAINDKDMVSRSL